jgi:tRNA (cmo5U34)-methyltransferase
MIDKVFDKAISKQFEFDEEVASVFDDMLERSVPYYEQTIDLTTSFALKFLDENDIVYDLGCSTASTLINLAQKSDKKLNLIGIDNSDAMLQRAQRKSNAYGANITLINDDILEVPLKKSKVIIANYTLQFIRPLQREKLIKKLYDSLEDTGVFIFSEKIISKNANLNKLYIDHYYDFKKQQGYSSFEIAQKREALENVLIPYTEDENIKMMKDAGFSHCETLFKWVKFATFIAIK